ncbi:hypothetical protein T01_876 [Trichinella spiralis]|uniref:Uncharacterized protein n=1 Tax=Trichinella spiralis TaxID=6334 RepID=A0A0V1BI67_TRISP|nr:hypothetical protein T01_876 [Trichinella spiralis]
MSQHCSKHRLSTYVDRCPDRICFSAVFRIQLIRNERIIVFTVRSCLKCLSTAKMIKLRIIAMMPQKQKLRKEVFRSIAFLFTTFAHFFTTIIMNYSSLLKSEVSSLNLFNPDSANCFPNTSVDFTRRALPNKCSDANK